MQAKLSMLLLSLVAIELGLLLGRGEVPAPAVTQDREPMREELARLHADIERLALGQRVTDTLPAPTAPQATPPTQSGEPQAPAGPKQPTPSELSAVNAGTLLVDDAIATGRWGEAESERLRTLRAELPRQTLKELKRKLIVAINHGKVELHGMPPPF